ncbi:MAG TPA: hypothetical protein PL124_10430 [Candidatus Cloacimonadota bacterium]|nr:hypothetical protein [Candidatus Cloacimonadota bacterium]HPS39818.1 hypothetical protein [Candidatus Cloacimonadota bacterium]
MRNILIVLLVMILLTGCDIFGLRDAQPPSAPAPWNDYATDWMLCLENLTYCYTDARNVVKYSGLFITDYRFYFATQDAQEHNITQIWTRSEEQDMLINLHNQSVKITLSLSVIPGSPDEILASEAKLYRQYSLSVKSTSSTTVYGGSMELHLKLSGGYWYISKWYDYRGGSAPTWGMLKYGYSQ